MDNGYVELSSFSLKVERENAEAMISGFAKDNEIHHVSIFTAHERAWSLKANFREVPKLITAKRSRPRAEYPLSRIGRLLDADSYRPRNKFAAVLTDVLHIRNDMSVWESLCNNGVFDIWEPVAPYNSLANRKDPMILVFRLYELERELQVQPEGYCDLVVEPVRRLKVVRPVVSDSEFESIRQKVFDAAAPVMPPKGHERCRPAPHGEVER